MNFADLRMRLLEARLILARLGWVNLLAGICFAAGLGACVLLLPELSGRLADRQAELTELQAKLRREAHQAPSAPLVQSNLAAFRGTLGDVRQAEQAVRTIFSEADGQLLALDEAEYKLSYERAGGFYAYSLQMPVKGGYLAMRIFCERVLLALPFAALDDIAFKRRAAGETTLDVKLHFTLYLDGPPDYGAGIAATNGRVEAGR
jgi:hypothetical protein